jgi:hypothetical protein
MIKNKLKQFIIDWVWQLPQNLLGYLYKTITNTFIVYKPKDSNTNITYYANVLSGSVSLGNYVFLCDSHQDNKKVILHETGHCKQSKILGPLYLLVIGLPSIIWATLYSFIPYFNKNYNYYDFYTEKWANDLIL